MAGGVVDGCLALPADGLRGRGHVHHGHPAAGPRMTDVLLDLDGVVWLADQPIPGAVAAVARLRSAGHRTLFVTNNSALTIEDYVAKLKLFGVDADPVDLLTSAMAAAGLLEAGTTALVCAGPGVTQALEAAGVRAVREGKADAVVVGWHRDFDYERLTAAFRAV